MGKKPRPCDDVLSDLMAFGHASDASVCLERKLDGFKEGKNIDECKKSLKTKRGLQTFFDIYMIFCEKIRHIKV